MKLLMCPLCLDIFNLNFTTKVCSCGHVSGKYINYREAVTNGNGISIGLDNNSVTKAIAGLRQGYTGDRDYFINKCSITCWLRPNEGPGNPHTKVISNILEEEVKSND